MVSQATQLLALNGDPLCDKTAIGWLEMKSVRSSLLKESENQASEEEINQEQVNRVGLTGV